MPETTSSGPDADPSDESTKLVLNLVATNNRYIHVPNEFVREFD